jgi:hypothetical protein
LIFGSKLPLAIVESSSMEHYSLRSCIDAGCTQYTSDYDFLIESYTKELNRTIDSYKHDDVFYERQSNHFNEFYSWDKRIVEWKRFLSGL